MQRLGLVEYTEDFVSRQLPIHYNYLESFLKMWIHGPKLQTSELVWRCKLCSLTLFLFFYFMCLFIWLRWVFVAVLGLPLVAASRDFSWGVWARGHVGFCSCGSWALECRLSGCDAWAWLPWSMWDLPGPGMELVSPALEDVFLITGPPGKSLGKGF